MLPLAHCITLQSPTTGLGKTQTVLTGYQIAVHNPSYWYKPTTWLYAITRTVTNSYWNHWAGIVISDRGVLVMEMRGRSKKRGIRKTSYDIWLARRKDRVFEILPVACNELTLEAITTAAGIGYDYWSLLIWHPLYKLFRRWFEPIRLQNMPYNTCSELWARLLAQPQAHRLSPGDLAVIFGASRK